MIYLLHLFTMSFCLILLYKRAGKIALDPGLILVFVIAFSVTGNILFYEFLSETFNNNAWVLWESRESMQNIVLLNVIFSSVFTFFYLSICKLQSSEIDTIPKHIYKSQYNPIYWFLVYAIIFVLGQLLFVLNQTYILSYWNNVLDCAYLIALGSILIQIKGIRTTFFFLSLFILFTMFIYHPIIIGTDTDVEGYVINKGGVVNTLIFCLVFLSLTKYKQLLVSPKKIIYGLIFLPLFLGFANFVEDSARGVPPALSTFLIYTLSGYEFQMMENQAIIFDDIEENNLDLKNGETYIRALYDIFIPTSGYKAPNQWFAERMNLRHNTPESYGYAFSFLAEGLLNFGSFGVAISGFIAAIVLSSLRLLYSIRLFLKPAMIASLITLPYYVYRSDFSVVIQKMEFMVLSFLIVSTIYLLVKYIIKKGTVAKNLYP